MPVWHASAARSSGTASAAPDASPSRMPRSSSGAQPHRSVQQPPVRGLGRDMRREAMVQHARPRHRKRRGGRRADETVQQHRDAALPGRHDRARQWRRVPGRPGSAPPPSGPCRHDAPPRPPPPRACGPARPRPRPCRGRSSPRRRTAGCTAPPPPWCCRSPSRPGTAGRCPAAPRPARPRARRRSWRGPSPARPACPRWACPRSSGTTRKGGVGDIRASWLIAAPPIAKLPTICAVTAAG